MPIRQSRRRVSAARLESLTVELLDAARLCAIATASGRGAAHINTAYFAWSPAFELVWVSEPASDHSRNLRARPSAAIAVYDSRQTWGRPDRGIQLFGTAREAAGRSASSARTTYVARFPAFADATLEGYRLYRFRPRRIKVFHEPSLGSGVFVTAAVRHGRLTWERTELYA